MRNRTLRSVSLGAALAVLALTAARPGEVRAEVGTAPGVARGAWARGAVAGCDILILWHTYRGSIRYYDTAVRIRGGLWSKLLYPFFSQIPDPPPIPRTNGRIYNWTQELKQERCDRWRRYRFKVVAPDSTNEPVRSNVPWAGTERWLYYPSSTGWTQKTTLDLGYLDWCVIDGTKCSKPYYPSGPTPILDK